MCYAIFALLLGLLFLYSDLIVQEHALSMRLNDEWMIVAQGWEMVQVLWPVLLLALVVGSALTYLAPRLVRRLRSRREQSHRGF
jgi:membrane protein implicated in regulation of membrane protease activity